MSLDKDELRVRGEELDEELKELHKKNMEFTQIGWDNGYKAGYYAGRIDRMIEEGKKLDKQLKELQNANN